MFLQVKKKRSLKNKTVKITMINMKPGLFSSFVASVFILSVICLSSTIDCHFENLYKPKLHSIQFLIDLLRSDFSSIQLTLFFSLIIFTFCFRLFPLCIFRARQAPMSTYIALPTKLFTTSCSSMPLDALLGILSMKSCR